ncbi:FAD-binding protein [Pseudomonas sp. R151218B TE3479]
MNHRYFGDALISKYEDITIIFPDDSAYEKTRQVYNRMHDLYPSMIIQTLNRAALKEIVSFVTANGIELAIRGGGHHIAGFGSTQGGILLDFSPFNDIVIDGIHKIARVQPGARLKDVDDALCQHGYVIPTGTVSDTGIAGLTLGGGIGWLLGKYGYTCENLVGADVLLATGALVRAEDPGHEDLLWALRGGGGNFGIVLEFRYKLSRLPSVYCGTLEFTGNDVEAALSDLFKYLDNHCPSNLVVAPILHRHKNSMECMLSIDFCLSDSIDYSEIKNLEECLSQTIKHTYLTNDFLTWQSWSDERFAQPMRGYWKSVCPEIMGENISHLLTDWQKKIPGPNCSVMIEHLNPSRREKSGVESALSIKTMNYGILFSARWTSSCDDAKYVSWVKSAASSITGAARALSYSNYTLDEENTQFSVFSNSDNRLSFTKKKYDPLNVFRRNHNITKK